MNQLSEQLYRSLVQHRQQPAVLWLGGLQPGSHITLSYSQLLAAAAFVHARLPLGAGARLALACQGPVAAAAVCAGLLYGWSLVPLNPEEPRLGSMLASAQPQAMLCTAKSPAAAQAGRLRLVEAEGLEEAMLRCVVKHSLSLSLSHPTHTTLLNLLLPPGGLWCDLSSLHLNPFLLHLFAPRHQAHH